jgi:hypothetical protein
MQSKTYSKHIIFISFFLFFTFSFNAVSAQITNTGINFQAVARDKEQNAANNRKIYVKSRVNHDLCKLRIDTWSFELTLCPHIPYI